MAAADATVLRQRAARLRRSASLLDDSEWWSLRRRAGAETWQGPTATAFLDALATAESELAAAHDELVTAAAWLDRLAERADAEALAAALRTAAGGAP